MNKDHLKGSAKDIAGKAQREAGGMTGDKSQQAKGLAKQAEGKTQKKLGDLKDKARGARQDRDNRDIEREG
jgi:uncharacterized protein YjbJ (UPF0337 family)